MTYEQITWAKEHEWFISDNGNSVIVNECVVYNNGDVTNTHKQFNDFKTLREWAGY